MPISEMAEAVAQLEQERDAILSRIAELLRTACSGQGDVDASAIPVLTAKAAGLAKRIADARAHEADTAGARERARREEARLQFDDSVSRAKSERERFLRLFREAALSWGTFLTESSKACEVSYQLTTPFGLLPHDQSALRDLTLDGAQILAGIEDTFGFTDHNSRAGIQLTPRRRTRG